MKVFLPRHEYPYIVAMACRETSSRGYVEIPGHGLVDVSQTLGAMSDDDARTFCEEISRLRLNKAAEDQKHEALAKELAARLQRNEPYEPGIEGLVPVMPGKEETGD